MYQQKKENAYGFTKSENAASQQVSNRGLRRKLKPETYLLQEENGNLFMNTGFRIDVAYNEATDVLTFSPNGDYVRVKPQPETPAEK